MRYLQILSTLCCIFQFLNCGNPKNNTGIKKNIEKNDLGFLDSVLGKYEPHSLVLDLDLDVLMQEPASGKLSVNEFSWCYNTGNDTDLDTVEIIRYVPNVSGLEIKDGLLVRKTISGKQYQIFNFYKKKNLCYQTEVNIVPMDSVRAFLEYLNYIRKEFPILLDTPIINLEKATPRWVWQGNIDGQYLTLLDTINEKVGQRTYIFKKLKKKLDDLFSKK